MVRWVIRKVDVKETSDINQETVEVDNNCVICLEVLANESLKPAKMKRHLQCKYQSFTNKPTDFFRRKKMELQGQKQVITKNVALPVKAQMASYEVAHLIAQRKKPHTIGEELIKPAALAMCRAIHGEKMARDLESIPLSNNMVGRRIHEIASDILIQLMERVENVNYALQLHKSTNISSSSQLLAFIRYSFNGKLNEDMLFCLALEEKCTGDDIFMALDKKLHELGLSWDRCVGI
ncbi:protein FAM200B-like [Macrobrachium rosenbergii]|uniref:protein FAM200B-like n=1 Tax=Macrobrachium rosenbergii TaxID=79674 RepID=UPI0034D3B895